MLMYYFNGCKLVGAANHSLSLPSSSSFLYFFIYIVNIRFLMGVNLYKICRAHLDVRVEYFG